MPREPRIRKLHHEERTGNIHREASSFDSVIDTVNKIIDFIDDKYEKEKNIVGEMDYRTIPCEKHKFERSCDCHVHKSEEKKCICNEFCKNWPKYPVYTWEKCECHCHKEPVSERNANPDTLTATIIAREGEERLRLVRNALIDELIEEMNEMYDPDTRSNESRRGYDEAFSHFSNLLKSKKK